MKSYGIYQALWSHQEELEGREGFESRFGMAIHERLTMQKYNCQPESAYMLFIIVPNASLNRKQKVKPIHLHSSYPSDASPSTLPYLQLS